MGAEHTEIHMTALTGRRTPARRSHLRLVTANERPSAAPVVIATDPEPGPKDVSELVARFSRILPGDITSDGVFSFGLATGDQTQPPA
jgi:hypothetical protein